MVEWPSRTAEGLGVAHAFATDEVTMPRISAGLVIYRIIKDGVLQVLLAQPGGPLFHNKDDGAWSIPKGEIETGEDLLAAAQREFEEPTGVRGRSCLVQNRRQVQSAGPAIGGRRRSHRDGRRRKLYRQFQNQYQ
jgi:8-oxo-dGTP pyrophosphatase MutT (NUDIX family)